jgi:hypothetical protein
MICNINEKIDGSRLYSLRRAIRMRLLNWHKFVLTLLIGLASLGMLGGCDSGEKVIDEVTGNRAVKQYHRSKKNIEKAAQQQAQKYQRIQEETQEDED